MNRMSDEYPPRGFTCAGAAYRSEAKPAVTDEAVREALERDYGRLTAENATLRVSLAAAEDALQVQRAQVERLTSDIQKAEFWARAGDSIAARDVLQAALRDLKVVECCPSCGSDGAREFIGGVAFCTDSWHEGGHR